jgi:1-acyl-sn-glycerol-3-phosphate acyltransferase
MYGLLLVMGLIWLPALLMPKGVTLFGVRIWCRLVLGGLRLICGVRVEVRGLQHRPTGPALIGAKHQSMLDTIAPWRFLEEPCFVLKQELLRLPVYGWYARKSDMVAVDREAHAKALRQLVTDARAQLDQQRQLIIFPEGTRQDPGAPADYKPASRRSTATSASPAFPWPPTPAVAGLATGSASPPGSWCSNSSSRSPPASSAPPSCSNWSSGSKPPRPHS